MPEQTLVEQAPAWLRCYAEQVLDGTVMGVNEAKRLNAIAERIERLEAALRKARDKFREYEQLHRLKNTPEGVEKAKRNCEMADELSAALSASNEGEE